MCNLSKKGGKRSEVSQLMEIKVDELIGVKVILSNLENASKSHIASKVPI